MNSLLSVVLVAASLCASLTEGYQGDRVLLQNVQALTLAHGQMTNSRRSHAVPQLKCVGGTAAGKFVPQVVQCHNKGSDGYDVQWECKTDMDNAYRFGRVDVTCEGYDYPDDPYILRGSCGLEYTLDYTKEGYEQNQRGGHHNYDNEYHDRSSNYYNSYSSRKTGSGSGNLIMLGVAAAIIYFIYKKCLSVEHPAEPTAPRDDAPPPYSRYDSQAPPPGFKPEYTSSSGGNSCGSGFASAFGMGGNTGSHRNSTGTGTGGGFWSGMATGGLLGYLFGNNQGYGNYHRPNYYSPRSTWGGSNWGGSSWGSGFFGGGSNRGSSWSSGSSGSRSSSSGTRTASGFGGTKRR